MTALTTKKALEELFSQKLWYKAFDMNRATAHSLLTRFKAGKLTQDKQDELLEKAGYKVKQEKLWEK